VILDGGDVERRLAVPAADGQANRS
jgi:hypothetical protein